MDGLSLLLCAHHMYFVIQIRLMEPFTGGSPRFDHRILGAHLSEVTALSKGQFGVVYALPLPLRQMSSKQHATCAVSCTIVMFCTCH
jgi:hypothetical protein